MYIYDVYIYICVCVCVYIYIYIYIYIGGQGRTFSWRSLRICLRCSASAPAASAARPFTSSYLER